MACRICGGSLRQIPAVYPTFHCGVCGSLLESGEDGIRVTEPVFLVALREAGGECLRNDAERCVVYDLARASGRCRMLDVVSSEEK